MKTKSKPQETTPKGRRVWFDFSPDDCVLLDAMKAELSAIEARAATDQDVIAAAVKEWLSTRRVKRWLNDMLEKGREG